jgi:hypothetical protein
MKAKDRCKAVLNGERCEKARFHDFETAPERDEVHEGAFTRWRGEGESRRVLAKVQGAMPRIRRGALRKVDKLIAHAGRLADQGGAGRKQAIAVLDFVGKGLTRG